MDINWWAFAAGLVFGQAVAMIERYCKRGRRA